MTGRFFLFVCWPLVAGAMTSSAAGVSVSGRVVTAGHVGVLDEVVADGGGVAWVAAKPANGTARRSGRGVSGGGSTSHTVRAGDTLYSIGRKHGVSAAQLAQANGLGPNAVIRPGQKLTIPNRGAKTALDEVKRPVASKKSGPESPPATYGQHTVRRGETVRGLSAKFGVSEKEFMTLNGLKDPTRLRAGAVVKYPRAGGAGAMAGAASEEAVAKPGEAPLPSGWQWHEVEAGESLSRIAARHGQDRVNLERANNLSADDPIYEGLKLKIPPVGMTFEKAAPEVERRPPEGQDHSVLAYRVRKGDTLEELAEVFLTTPAILRKLNRLPPEAVLAAGQRIVVPNNLFE